MNDIEVKSAKLDTFLKEEFIEMSLTLKWSLCTYLMQLGITEWIKKKL